MPEINHSLSRPIFYLTYNKLPLHRFLGIMRKISLIYLMFVSALGFSQEIQHAHEIGAGLGVMHYSGDLAPKIVLKDLSPSFQFFYKKNFPNNYSVIRANVLAGSLVSNAKNQKDPLLAHRNRSLDVGITEFALMYEYNFLNFRQISRGKNEDFFLSPYMFAGLGAAVTWGGNSPSYLVLPMGVGLKYQASKNINLSIEFGMRKTFTDQLDGFSDDKEYSSSIRYDSYYNTSVIFSYTFYNDLCADHYKKR